MTSTSEALEKVDDKQCTFHPLFNDEDADIILISSDGTRFRLPRFTLKKASGYFRDIVFSKPLETHEFIVPYHAEPLKYVLCMITGLPATQPSTFEEIEQTIGVLKYLDTPGPLNVFLHYVLPTCYDEPIKLYVLGIKTEVPELEQHGAALTLPINLLSTKDPSIIDQVSQLSTAALLKLLKFHQRHREDFRKKLKKMENPPLSCSGCQAGMNAGAWRGLVVRLLEEIELDCSGSRILGPEIEDWSESKACWGYRCNRSYCEGAYERENTLKVVRDIVANLTEDVNSPD